MGTTRVMSVVTAALEAPYPDRPTEGPLRFNVEFSPMASPAFEPGRPGACGAGASGAGMRRRERLSWVACHGVMGFVRRSGDTCLDVVAGRCASSCRALVEGVPRQWRASSVRGLA